MIIVAGPMIQSIQSVLMPKTFYVHKKSFQREALDFVNTAYKPGDMVYVYWNNLPGYRLYKEMYHYKFTAIEGMDVRKKSIDFEHYIANLKSDFDQLASAKKIWVIVNNQFLTDIGDKLDDPAWYYKSGELPTQHLIREFRKHGKIKSVYKTSDVSVYLVKCNSAD